MVPDLAPGTSHCQACGFFASELPIQINSVDRIDEDVRERALKPVRLANFQQLLAECADYLPRGTRLLDVGCAHGWFLEAAKTRGIECVGIEPDVDMERRARLAGHDVIAGFFPAEMPPDMRFDAIIFNDVFEHLPDVSVAASVLSDYLLPGGAVIVNLPVAEGFIFRAARLAARFGVTGPLNRMWQIGLPSPHVSYFTSAALSRLFTTAGFALLRQGQLASIVTDGLYDRIRYDRSVGALKAGALYTLAVAAVAFSKFFPSDIQYFIFQRQVP
ncbi:class I SAM-dependent methyltransferase [Rhodopila sp.]|uniref:class I SAM-dependent methyltransferase n=1 Tax=Rhodopila sp. TaxID=2480087 RepID=UPI003D0CC3AF